MLLLIHLLQSPSCRQTENRSEPLPVFPARRQQSKLWGREKIVEKINPNRAVEPLENLKHVEEHVQLHEGLCPRKVVHLGVGPLRAAAQRAAELSLLIAA